MEIGVIAVRTGLATTLVASSLPPSPVSSNSRSAGVSAKARKAAAVVISNRVISSPSLAASARARQSTSSPSAIGAEPCGPGQHDALMEMDEMGRGIDMHAFAERLGDGAGESEERAFAVGAGDMQHRRQLLLGMTECGEQALDPPERQVDRLRMELFQPLQQRIARRDPEAG